MVLPANDVRDLHLDVVANNRQIIKRMTVGAQQNEVFGFRVIAFLQTVNRVFKRRFACLRQLSDESQKVRPLWLLRRILLLTNHETDGAAEVATLAGGLRRGEAQAEPAIAPPGTAVACLDGRIVAVAPEAEAADALAAALEAAGATADAIDRLDAAGATITPGLVDAHTHLAVRRLARGRGRDAGAGRDVPRDPRGRRRDPLDRPGDAGRLGRCAPRRTGGAGWARCCGRGRRRSRRSPATASTWRPSCACSRSPAGSAAEGPVDVIPTFLGAHAVPPEVRAAHPGDPGARRPRRTWPRSSGSSCRPSRPRGSPAPATSSARAGVFTADQARRILLAARALGLDVRLHADELAPSGGAELAAELGALSADHLGAPSAAGIARAGAAAADGRPAGRRGAPARPCPGSWGSPTREPARELIAAGVPVALATDFNPGTSPVTSLPLVMTTAAV